MSDGKGLVSCIEEQNQPFEIIMYMHIFQTVNNIRHGKIILNYDKQKLNGTLPSKRDFTFINKSYELGNMWMWVVNPERQCC